MTEAPAAPIRRSIRAHFLGRIPYRRAHALQASLVEARIRGDIGDTLLLLEHDSVITLGRSADAGHIIVSESSRSRLGVDCVETGRGGDVTFHGPGQLVAYPIFDLKPDRCDVRKYVQDLAAIMVDLAALHGVGAGVVPGDQKLIGVWVDLASKAQFPGPETRGRIAKIGAIGVRLSRWVTMHGFAFNATTDLAKFALIVPCGITEYGVTSLASLEAGEPSVAELAKQVLPLFASRFDADVTPATADETQALFSLPAAASSL